MAIVYNQLKVKVRVKVEMKLRTGDVDKLFIKKEYSLRIEFYGELKNNSEENGIYCFEFDVKEKPKNLRKYGKMVLKELTKDPLSVWEKAKLKSIQANVKPKTFFV